MIKSIRVANFRGFAGQDRKFVVGRSSATGRGCVTSITGMPSSGKSSLVSALELLQMIARGARSTDQLHYGEQTAISSDFGKPCDIVLRFTLSETVFEYGLRLECDLSARCWKIENEWLNVGKDDGLRLSPVFVRSGTLVEIGGMDAGGGSYELDQKVFVLSTFTPPDRMHPLYRTRVYLANLFILGDKLGSFDDRVPAESRPGYFFSRGEHLGAWLSFQMKNRAGFYSVLADVLRRHLQGFDRLVLAHEATAGSHLAVMYSKHPLDCKERIVPIWMLSTVERTVLWGAIIATVGKVFSPQDCICDDFDLIEEHCPKLAAEIGRVYADAGHLVGLHKRNIKLYANCYVRLSKETEDVQA